MLRRGAHVRTDAAEERIASIIGVTTIGELRTTLAVTSNRSTGNVPMSPIFITLMMEPIILRNFGSYKSHTA
jgi:hypothetical protein